MITFVWAEDQKRQIGQKGHLPWHLPADMKHFKELTVGHPIVMGRKTFDSLPAILPGRQHVVLTKRQDLANSQVEVVNSLAKLNEWLDAHRSEQIYVIGGATIFQALKDHADCLERTVIKASFAGDTRMPRLDYSKFRLVNKRVHGPDERNKYSYEFLTYLRKTSFCTKNS